METKEFKIEVPDGYEIDKENSTFEKIVFKPIGAVNAWKDITTVIGWFITTNADIKHCYIPPSVFETKANKNVFINSKYAKSALALAQISQILPYYDADVVWNCPKSKFVIYNYNNHPAIAATRKERCVLAFNTEAEAERFLQYNEQLVKDYLMIDDENNKV